jgi:hypothetical protein
MLLLRRAAGPPPRRSRNKMRGRLCRPRTPTRALIEQLGKFLRHTITIVLD